MKSPAELARFLESVESRPMFKAIIKYQIQTLIAQLSNAGEESVLLTACTTELGADDDVIGSQLAVGFVHERFDVVAAFRDYCYLKWKEKEVFAAESSKRKLSENNGESSMEASPDDDVVMAPDGKKIKVERETTPEPAPEPRDNTQPLPFSLESSMFNPHHLGASLSSPNLLSTNIMSPNLMSPNMPSSYDNSTNASFNSSNASFNSSNAFKSLHKCSQCSYTSKFKANVVRHERSIHGINVEGAPGPTIQYACTLCTYKSLYRSNLMRHEKNVHKLEPVQQDAEFSHLGMTGQVDGFSTLSSTPRDETTHSLEPDQSSSDPSQQTLKEGSDGECSRDGVNGCHTCTYCQLLYPTMQQLKVHIDQAHYSSGKYECGKCRLTFDHLALFQTHMATHYLNKQEKCICGRTFQYRVSLLKHIPKCVVAKETNFKMPDVVLGSGVEMESCQGSRAEGRAEGRADGDQGAGRLETGAGLNSGDPGGSREQEQEEHEEKGVAQQAMRGSEQDRWGSEPGGSDTRWQSEQEENEIENESDCLDPEQTGYSEGWSGAMFGLWGTEQGNSEQESEQGKHMIRVLEQGNSEQESEQGIGRDINVDVENIPEPVPRGTFKPVKLHSGPPTIITLALETTDQIRGGQVPHIIQITAEVTRTGEKFNTYVKPRDPITSDVQNIAGISMTDSDTMLVKGKMVDAPSITTAIEKLCAWLEKFQNVCIIAHNGRRFVFHVLVSALINCDMLEWFFGCVAGLVDSLTIFRKSFPDQSLKQEDLVQSVLGIKNDVHDAMNDVTTLGQLFAFVNLSDTELMSHSFNPAAMYNSLLFNEQKALNIRSLDPLVTNGICKRPTAENIAGSGLQFFHLKAIFERSGEDGIKDIFTMKNSEGLPRVTGVQKVLDEVVPKIGQFFSSD